MFGFVKQSCNEIRWDLLVVSKHLLHVQQEDMQEVHACIRHNSAYTPCATGASVQRAHCKQMLFLNWDMEQFCIRSSTLFDVICKTPQDTNCMNWRTHSWRHCEVWMAKLWFTAAHRLRTCTYGTLIAANQNISSSNSGGSGRHSSVIALNNVWKVLYVDNNNLLSWAFNVQLDTDFEAAKICLPSRVCFCISLYSFDTFSDTSVEVNVADDS